MNWLLWWLPKPKLTLAEKAAAIVAAVDTNEGMDEAYEALYTAGFEVLGNGVYGVVIQDGDKVLKFFTACDEGYLAFLDICMAYPSPYLPEVYWLKDMGNGIFAVSLEYLDSYDNFIESNETNRTYKIIKHSVNRHRISPEADEELQETLRIMFEHRQGLTSVANAYLCVDIHDGNVMMRGEQMVITDPWCG